MTVVATDFQRFVGMWINVIRKKTEHKGKQYTVLRTNTDDVVLKEITELANSKELKCRIWLGPTAGVIDHISDGRINIDIEETGEIVKVWVG